MSAWTLCSCLAPQVETFIKLRQLSGTDYHSQAQLLGYFDRFLVEQGFHQPCITRDICDRYQQSLVRLAPRGQSNRICVVRQLCEYLACTDPLNHIPDSIRSPSWRFINSWCFFSNSSCARRLRSRSTESAEEATLEGGLGRAMSATRSCLASSGPCASRLKNVIPEEDTRE